MELPVEAIGAESQWNSSITKGGRGNQDTPSRHQTGGMKGEEVKKYWLLRCCPMCHHCPGCTTAQLLFCKGSSKICHVGNKTGSQSCVSEVHMEQVVLPFIDV